MLSKSKQIKRGSVVRVKLDEEKFFRGIAIQKDKSGWYIVSSGACTTWPEKCIEVEFHIEGKKTLAEYMGLLPSIREWSHKK